MPSAHCSFHRSPARSIAKPVTNLSPDLRETYAWSTLILLMETSSDKDTKMTHLNGNAYAVTQKVDALHRQREQLVRTMLPICHEIKEYLGSFIYDVKSSATVNKDNNILSFQAFNREFEVRLDSRWDEKEVLGRIAVYINTNEGMLCFKCAEFKPDGEAIGFTIGEKDSPDPLPIDDCAGVLVAHWLLSANRYFYQSDLDTLQ